MSSIFHANTPRLLAVAIAASVIAGTVTAPSDAAVANEHSEVQLDRTYFPLVGIEAEAIALAAADATGQVFDPEMTSFIVDETGTAVTQVEFDNYLPVGASISEVTLSLTVEEAPSANDISASVMENGAQQQWDAASPVITLTGQEPADIEWTYGAPGNYVLEIAIDATISNSTMAPQDEEESLADDTSSAEDEEEATVETELLTSVTRYDVRVESPTVQTEPVTRQRLEGSTGDAEEPSASAPSPELQARATDLQEITVVDSEEVAFAPRLAKGVLETGLLHGGDYLPAASTVLHVPNQETEWPGVHANGDAQNTALWEEVVAPDVLPWRTTGIQRAWQREPAPRNELVFTISGELLDAPEDTTVDFISASGAEGSRFAMYGERPFSSYATLLWDNQRPVWGTALASNRYYNGVLGEDAGVYCLTVETVAGDEPVRDTLTFVMGDLPEGNGYLCEQDEGSDPEEPGPEDPELAENVIDAGEVRISPDIKNWRLGLQEVDSSGDAGEYRDPAETVLYLPEQDQSHPSVRNIWWGFIYPAEDLAYRTTGQPLGSRNSVANNLGITFDNGGVPVPVDFRLRKTMTSAGGGYFASYRTTTSDSTPDTSSFPVWDSRPTGVTRDLMTTTGKPERSGWLFSEPGTYCLTFSADLTGYFGDTFYNTFTVVVGEHPNPGEVEMCQSPATMDDDNIQYPDNGVTYLDRGHLDIGLLDMGGGPGLGIKVDGAQKPVAFEDAVLVGNKPHNRRTAAAGADFIAPAGSEYWYFSLESQADYTLWPGWAFVLNGQTKGPATWSVLDVTGPSGGDRPGDMVVYLDHGDVIRGNANSILFSTKRGLPESVGSINDHVHTNWAFTAPGVYCVSLEAKWQAQDGKRHSDRNVLTVTVGDSVDPTTVLPCTESMEEPYPGQELSDLSPTSAGDGEVLQSGTVALTPLVDENGKNGGLLSAYRADATTAPSYYDAEEVVYSTSRQATSTTWEFGRYEVGSNPNLNLDSRYLEQNGVSDEVTMEFGEISGPGDMRVEREGYGVAFDSRQAQSQQAKLLPGWFEQNMLITFTAAGTYCVPLKLNIPTSGGGHEAVSKTLTFVAGNESVSRNVEVCADGGEGSGPGEGGETPEEPIEWNVPNGSKTRGGATIINNGHVDIASLVEKSQLKTHIKDDTTGTGQPVYREAEATVLQILPGARTTIQSEAQSFIGNIGDPIWQVTETPQSGLLWPGWSTERVPLDATRGGVDWKLNAVDGPGEVAVFANGAQQVYFNTKDGITDADRFEIPKNTHTHANWTFTAEGVYCMAWERTATLASNSNRVSDTFVTAFAVGEVNVKDVDPSKCFAEPAGKPGDDERGKAPTNLNEGNAGDVMVLGNDTGFTSGQLVTVQVGEQYAGQWVSVWVGTSWMGWAYVNESGAAQARIPVNVKPGGHRLAVMDREGALIGWDSVSVVAAQTPGGVKQPPGPDGTPAVNSVAAEQCVAGATILSSGHIDYASRIVGGKLESLIGDDTSGTKMYREPSGTILWLKPEARKGGVWQVPQSQNLNLIWLGWSTEGLHSGNARGTVNWTINSISGPGSVTVYTSGVFGGVQEMVFDNGGSKSINLGVHAHANWDFSAEGIYRINTTQTVTLANGQRSSDTETLTIAVGNVDPASAAIDSGGSGCGVVSNAMLLEDGDADKAAQAAAQAQAEAAKVARDRMPGDGASKLGVTNPFEALASGDPVPLLLSVLAALLATGATGSGVMWWRRRSLAAL